MMRLHGFVLDCWCCLQWMLEWWLLRLVVLFYDDDEHCWLQMPMLLFRNLPWFQMLITWTLLARILLQFWNMNWAVVCLLFEWGYWLYAIVSKTFPVQDFLIIWFGCCLSHVAWNPLCQAIILCWCCFVVCWLLPMPCVCLNLKGSFEKPENLNLFGHALFHWLRANGNIPFSLIKTL